MSPPSELLMTVSLLLRYPTEEMMQTLEAVEDALVQRPADPAALHCRRFLTWLRSKPLIRVQESYTEDFDLNPPTCLNMTYHRWGDGKERTAALVGLVGCYREAGLEMQTEEIPDYLPMMLEFFTVCDPQVGGRLMQDYGEATAALAERLRARRSPYSRLVQAAAELFGAAPPEGEKRT